MKQADLRQEEKVREETEMKLRDLSEWKTASAESLKKKLLQNKKPAVVGYQTLHLIRNSDGPILGRRTFGEMKKEPELKTLEPQEDDQEAEDLDSMWKKDQRPKSSSKRPLTDGTPKREQKKRKSHP